MRVLVLSTAILTAWGGAAWAETPNAPGNAQPKYQTSFPDYRGFNDEPVKPWRESNEAMQRLGGHMGHLNDATSDSEVRPAGRETSADDKAPDGSRP